MEPYDSEKRYGEGEIYSSWNICRPCPRKGKNTQRGINISKYKEQLQRYARRAGEAEQLEEKEGEKRTQT